VPGSRREVAITPLKGRSAGEHRDHPSRSHVGPRWRPDPLVLAVGLVALTVYSLHGVRGNLTRDVGLYAYAGQQVADGVPPYLGVLNRAGPLAHAIPGLGAVLARLVGVDDLLGMRVLFLVIAVLSVCGVYLLARDLLHSRMSGLVAASMFLCLPGFIHHASYGPRDKTAMVLFLVLALWAMCRRRWFTAGVLLGLAALVLQIALFVGGPALAVAVLMESSTWRRRLASLARVAAGGLLTLAVTVVYFLAVGAFDEFVQAYALINARYTGANPVTDSWRSDWDTMVKGYGAALIVTVAGLLAVPVFAGLALRTREGRDDPDTGTWAGLAAGTIGGTLWTLRDFDSWPDAFPLLPLAAVGTAALLQALTRRLQPRAALTVAAAFVVVAGAAAVIEARDEDTRLDVQRASVRAMLRTLPEDATIISLEAPQPLVLSGRTNPTRHQMFPPGLDAYIDDTWPGGLDGFEQDVLDEEAELIAIRRPWRGGWGSVIRPDYVRVGCAPGWTWYARRDLGPERLLPLQRAGARFCRVGSRSAR